MKSLLIVLFACGSLYAGTAAYNTTTNRIVERKRGGADSSFKDRPGYAVTTLADENPLHDVPMEYVFYSTTLARVASLSDQEIQAKKQKVKNTEIAQQQSHLVEIQDLMEETTDQFKLDKLYDLELEIQNRISELQQ